MTKKRTRVMLASCLAVVLVLALAGSVVAAGGTTKSIKAIFSNIQLFDSKGQIIPSDSEPFIVNGRTFVPLRAIVEALGVNVDWDPATNNITIGAVKNAMQEKDIQIAQLQLKIAELQAQLDGNSSSSSSSSSSSDDADIKDLEKDLEDDYDKLEGIKIKDISLSGDERKVTVTIKLSVEKSDDEWEDLSKKDIEDWLEDLCDDIQKFYDDDTDISGKIKDEDNKTLVDFSKDGDDDVEVEIEGGDKTVDEVEDYLKENAEYSVDGVDFEISSINYRSSDKIDVTLTATEDASDLSTSDIKELVKDAGEDIAETFEEKCGENPETVIIDVEDEDGDELGNYEYDVDSRKVI